MNKIIYNYKLIRRFRKSWFWYIGYLVLFTSLFTLPMNEINEKLLFKCSIIVGSLYLSYLFWNILSLRRLSVPIGFQLPSIPWYGIRPKHLLSIHQFKQHESLVFNLSSITFIWMLFVIPKQFYLFFFAFYILLVGYRFFLFILIIFIRQSTEWIKYETFGLSVYQTDSFKEE